MASSSKEYHLEKSIWTDQDFEVMTWHDCRLFAIAFGDNYQLQLDIDYIFKWVRTGKTFKFWVSPCTLVFENVHDLEFQLDGICGGVDIDEITRETPQTPKNFEYIKIDTEFDWTIQTQQGLISFKSVDTSNMSGKTQALGMANSTWPKEAASHSNNSASFATYWQIPDVTDLKTAFIMKRKLFLEAFLGALGAKEIIWPDVQPAIHDQCVL